MSTQAKSRSVRRAKSRSSSSSKVQEVRVTPSPSSTEERVKAALSEALPLLRQEAGLSQAQAAQKIRIGMSAYSEYENGSRVPPSDRLLALAQLFNVSCDYLLGLSVKVPARMTLFDARLAETLKKAIDPEDFQRHVDNNPTMFLLGLRPHAGELSFVSEEEAERLYSVIFERAKKHAPAVVASWRRQHGLLE